MDDATFRRVCGKAVAVIKAYAPKRTGNLAYNAVRFEFVDDDTCRIYVDKDIAPYMPFTNEKWISKRWHGKKNPNEKWWDRACHDALRIIYNMLDAEALKKSKQEYKRAMADFRERLASIQR